MGKLRDKQLEVITQRPRDLCKVWCNSRVGFPAAPKCTAIVSAITIYFLFRFSVGFGRKIENIKFWIG